MPLTRCSSASVSTSVSVFGPCCPVLGWGRLGIALADARFGRHGLRRSVAGVTLGRFGGLGSRLIVGLGRFGPGRARLRGPGWLIRLVRGLGIRGLGIRGLGI